MMKTKGFDPLPQRLENSAEHSFAEGLFRKLLRAAGPVPKATALQV